MKNYPNKKPSTKAVIAYLNEAGWTDAAEAIEEWNFLYKADHPTKPRAKKAKEAEKTEEEKEAEWFMAQYDHQDEIRGSFVYLFKAYLRAIVKEAIRDSRKRRVPLSEIEAYKVLLTRAEREIGKIEVGKKD